MNICDDAVPWQDKPCFLPYAKEILQQLRLKSYEELKALWCCNAQLAKLNFERVQKMDLEEQLSPALLSYEGLQYQYMHPMVFTNNQWDYVQKHLRILSGFYGILKPLDGIVPYRLEMQAKLSMGSTENLYQYWGGSLYNALLKQETNQDKMNPHENAQNGKKQDEKERIRESKPVIINLASKEYSKAIEPYLTEGVRYITCIFGTLNPDGKVKVKATEAKMARGEMVYFLAEKNANTPEVMKEFKGQGFCYDETRSREDQWVFIK